MAKYIVKENKIITEFLGSLFNAIVKKKSSKILKSLSKDPVMNRHIKAANKLGKEIKNHIEKKKKDDPEYAATFDALNKLVGR